MRVSALGLALTAGLLIAGPALAFGTISLAFGSHKQDREHERITRHALGCGVRELPGLSPPLAAATCFQPKSLDELAGAKGGFGAVGAPDNPLRGLISSAPAHCDNGDYLDPSLNGGRQYRQTPDQAAGHLKACRAGMSAHLDAAVQDAGRILGSDGKVNDAEIPTVVGCSYGGHAAGTRGGRAKCNVLEDLGLLLHASEDFYSHSNWTDRPDPQLAGSRINPPGLGQTGPAPWLDLRKTGAEADTSFPPGLISGCFVSGFAAEDGCPHEVAHAHLNKDNGSIDLAGNPSAALLDFSAPFKVAAGPSPSRAGFTPRGAIEFNFQRAVMAAIDDTRGQWAVLRERLVTTYGPERGQRLICALTHDDAARDCNR
jgi:hypothetical protein